MLRRKEIVSSIYIYMCLVRHKRTLRKKTESEWKRDCVIDMLARGVGTIIGGLDGTYEEGRVQKGDKIGSSWI